jgi:hypothetical protein
MKYDPAGYCGGVLEHERHLVERFEDEVIGYVEKHGARIGEAAVSGDADAEAVILGYHRFVNGLPELRQANYRLCIAALKRWDAKRVH